MVRLCINIDVRILTCWMNGEPTCEDRLENLPTRLVGAVYGGCVGMAWW